MIDTKGSVSRRRFVQTAAGAIAAAPMIVPSSVLGQRSGQVPPSDRIVMAGLGIGNRGSNDLNNFLPNGDVQFVAICDVRNERREAVKATIDKANGNNDCRMYSEQFDLLAREDIDALLIATGDRWHAPLAILAAKHNKDVYCEKPCSMTIAESYALAEAFERHGRIYQAGCQRRNGGNFEFAVRMAQSGKLGKLTALHANAGTASRWPPKPTHDWLPAEPEPAPQVVDWNRWLGPCPWRPYNPLYVQGRWRNYFDFHGGGILEWGSHTADLCQWANQADDTMPVEYEPKGPNEGPYFVYCRYANGVQLVLRDEGWLGLGSCSVRFEGENGWVETGDTSKIEVSDNLKGELHPVDPYSNALRNHIRDFLNCIKTRSQPRANAASAANTHVGMHAAYIAYQLDRKLTWDPAKREFVNDAEANRMRTREMREPWRV